MLASFLRPCVTRSRTMIAKLDPNNTVYRFLFKSSRSSIQSKVVKAEKEIIDRMQDILRKNDAAGSDILLLQDTRARIEDLFLIVIAGEFNVGKSTLINSLLGYELVPTGVLPTTNKICIIRNNSSDQSKPHKVSTYFNSSYNSIEEKYMQADWLDNVAIVDTPGTNSVNSDHDALTKLIIPRADLIYFITSTERPLSESESVFLNEIKVWGKKIHVIVNKIDILSEAEQTSVISYVQQTCNRIFRSTTDSDMKVFGLSARKAMQALQLTQRTCETMDQSNDLWKESHFDAFYKHLLSTIQQGELIATKLVNPINIIEKLSQATQLSVQERLQLLESDERILEMIEENNSAFAEDIRRDVRLYRLHIDALCSKMTQRIDAFLDDYISVFRPFALLDVKAFADTFRIQAGTDIILPVEAILKDIADLVSQRSRSHAQGVLAFIGDRHRQIAGSMVGGLNDTSFDTSREQLFLRLEKEAIKLIAESTKSARVLSFGRQLSTTATTSLSTLAISGVVLSQVIDITGILAVSGLALGGLVLVPWKKEAIRKEFKSSVESLRNDLDSVVTLGLDQELTSTMIRIKSTIDPYARYVRISKAKLLEAGEQLVAVRDDAVGLREAIKSMQRF